MIFKTKFHFFLEYAFILAVDWDVKLAFLQEFLLRFQNLLFYNWIFQKNWSLKSNSLYDAQYFKLQYFYTGYCTPPKTSVNSFFNSFSPPSKKSFFPQKQQKKCKKCSQQTAMIICKNLSIIWWNNCTITSFQYFASRVCLLSGLKRCSRHTHESNYGTKHHSTREIPLHLWSFFRSQKVHEKV